MTPPLAPARVRQLLGVDADLHERIQRAKAIKPDAKPKEQRQPRTGNWAKNKITDEQRAEIRAAHARGEKCQAIANRFGVSVAYVSMLGNGQRGTKSHA